MRLKKTLLLTIFSIIAVIASLTPAIAVKALGSINLSISSGTVGSSLSVSGSGYNNSVYFSITFAGVPIASGTTSASGDASSSFSVPLKPRGTYTIVLTDGTNTNSASFMINPVVTAGSSSGYVGDTFFVSGNGFVASSTVTLYFDSTTVGSAYSDANGAFSSTTLTVPEISRGSHLVRGADSSGYSANSASFTVNPKVILSSATATAGSQITVSGNGYTASSTVSFYIDDVATTGSTTTTATGSFSGVTVTMPNVSGGSHTLKVQDSSGGSATTSISINAGLTISPTNGPANTVVTVTGKGFGSNKSITLTWKGAQIVTNPATITTDNSGSFSATVTAQPGLAGPYTVSASDGTLIASADFTMKVSINLGALSGEVGGSIPVNGTGFNANSAVSIKYDNIQVASVIADSSGAFSTTVNVPASVAGPHAVTATDSIITTSPINISVTSSVNLNPVSGFVGGDITIKGNGFSGGKTVTVKYDDIFNTTTTSDTVGSFTVSFKAPASKGGPHSITATDGTYTKTGTFAMDSTPPPVPSNLLPQDKSNADALTKFTWANVTDQSGVTYELQVSTDANFATIILDKKGLVTPGYQTIESEKFPTVGSDTPYYWRVKAIDGAGNESDWTKPQTFSVGFIFPTWGIYIVFGFICILAGAGGFWIGRRTSFQWDW